MKNVKWYRFLACIVIFFAFVFVLLLRISTEPKTNSRQAKLTNEEWIIKTLNETYNEEFVLIEESWERQGSGTDIDFSASKCYEYTLKTKNAPDITITARIFEEYLKTPEKWETDYLAVIYNTQAEEKLTQLLQPIYNDVQVNIEPQYSTLKNMTFDEYFGNYLSNSNISITSTNSHENKNSDTENLFTVLKENNITIDHIYIYYTDNKMDESWIENGEEAKHSIVYGSVWFEDNEIEECRWNYNNKGT